MYFLHWAELGKETQAAGILNIHLEVCFFGWWYGGTGRYLVLYHYSTVPCVWYEYM